VLLVYRLVNSCVSLFMSMTEIDPKMVESIKKVKAPTYKKELQSFLDKVNYLIRFISNLMGRVKVFTPIHQL
jgi:hypothetical protein